MDHILGRDGDDDECELSVDHADSRKRIIGWVEAPTCFAPLDPIALMALKTNSEMDLAAPCVIGLTADPAMCRDEWMLNRNLESCMRPRTCLSDAASPLCVAKEPSDVFWSGKGVNKNPL